jgi:hypothetical protein
LGNQDENLECCLRRVSFVLRLFYSVVLIVIHYFISQVLALSEKRHEKRSIELAQMAKLAELEVVMKSQADKITELEATCADLKHAKEKLTNGYQRLPKKHK